MSPNVGTLKITKTYSETAIIIVVVKLCDFIKRL